MEKSSLKKDASRKSPKLNTNATTNIKKKKIADQDIGGFVYMLECADKTLYIGSTNNLEKRLREHNTSKNGAHYTKIRRPVVLKYSEALETLSQARTREAELKRSTRTEKLKLFQ